MALATARAKGLSRAMSGRPYSCLGPVLVWVDEDGSVPAS